MGKSQELYKKAKRIIPGATQLLSKRAEMFLPDYWPAYYKKAKGIEVWDLDNKHYCDMSIMGVGACVLGYANSEVNKAVKAAINDGNMSTLNCPEEVELAQILIALHPWAEMVRYAKTGGEACAIAVRIARASSKKDKVLFCGYHGWNDWYLAANLGNEKNLDGQLLAGLAPAGVPRSLINSALPFAYGDIEGFKRLVEKHKEEIGVVIMEVARHEKVNLDFLKKVRQITQSIGAVLIFDEVSSGFRINTGGMHMVYGIYPDIVVLGKALGNGYPISCVIGTRNVMQAAQTTFISSTYWTERVGFAAALATIKIFKRDNVARKLVKTGEYLSKGLKGIFKKYSLKIEMVGIASMPIMAIKEDNPLVIKTIFIQEMLKKGFLATTAIYVSYAHTQTISDKYLKAADQVFGKISQALKSGTGTLEKMLKGPVCHSGFKRLA